MPLGLKRGCAKDLQGVSPEATLAMCRLLSDGSCCTTIITAKSSTAQRDAGTLCMDGVSWILAMPCLRVSMPWERLGLG